MTGLVICLSLGTRLALAQAVAGSPPGSPGTPAQAVAAAPRESVAAPPEQPAPVAAPPQVPAPEPGFDFGVPAPVAPVARPIEPGAGPAPYDPQAPPAPVAGPEPRRRRFVWALLPSLTMGISPLPSANVAVFVGARLPRGPWALGYQLTAASGLAERYGLGLLTHRHHIMAMRAFSASGRGFVSLGGGAAFLYDRPVVEAEGRLGLRFGGKRYGIVAAVVRLGWNLGMRERAPMPQFGVTFGFAFL